MDENVNISVNGQSQVPPGFRFHPTEEELLQYYLRKKVAYQKIDLDVIRDADLNKLEPWDIQGMCKIGTTPQNDWYFFSHKDRKYPTGTRTNRATSAGFWKATGRDKVIHSNCRRIGLRKTLVFYKGRAPHGQKSDWIMHEYRLDDNTSCNGGSMVREPTQEEGWVVCKIFKKKYHSKTLDSAPDSKELPRGSFFFYSCDEGGLEQIVQQQGRTFKEENESTVEHGGSPILSIDTGLRTTIDHYHDIFSKLQGIEMAVDSSGSSVGLTNWSEVDNLLACHFINGGQVESYSEELACFEIEPTLVRDSSTAAGQDHSHVQFPTGTSSSQSVMGYDSETGLWIFDESTA